MKQFLVVVTLVFSLATAFAQVSDAAPLPELQPHLLTPAQYAREYYKAESSALQACLMAWPQLVTAIHAAEHQWMTAAQIRKASSTITAECSHGTPRYYSNGANMIPLSTFPSALRALIRATHSYLLTMGDAAETLMNAVAPPGFNPAVSMRKLPAVLSNAVSYHTKAQDTLRAARKVYGQ